MKYFALALAFALADAATAAELDYAAPPPEQVFTTVSAVDWAGLHFDGSATWRFSALFRTPVAAPIVAFRTSEWLGGLQAGDPMENRQFAYATGGDPHIAGAKAPAPISPAETLAGETLRSGTEDRNGRRTLGVDISKVGPTPTQVKRFLLGLPADAASKVRSGCAAVMGDQGNYHPKLFRFCTVLPPKSVATIN